MVSLAFSPGQRVMILAHPQTHDFGQVAAVVENDLPPYGETVTVSKDDGVPFEVPRMALAAVDPREHVATAPAGEQLVRAAAGVATLALVFGSLLWLTSCAPAQAQEASAHAFHVIEAAPAPAPRRWLTKPRGRKSAGEVVETGRWVNIPLPPPPPYVRGRLTCAVNVNRYLARMGKPTTGSALAHSFLRWGRASGPQPGAVQVERRRGGGHVKIVSHHDGARWMCLNPSVSRQGWHLTPCGGRAVAWRSA